MPKKEVMVKNSKILAIVLILALISSGCATIPGSVRTSNDFKERQKLIRSFLLLKPDIEVHGFPEGAKGLVLLEEQSQIAIKNVAEAVKTHFKSKGYEVKYIEELEKFGQGELIDRVVTESTKTIETIKSIEYPKKSADFNYALGFELNKIGEETNSDVLLFIIGGARIGKAADKIGAAVVTTALGLAVGVLTGVGFWGYTHEDIVVLSAAIIDSKNSKVLWFNTTTIVDLDITRPTHADRGIKNLFWGFPKAHED